MIKNMNINIKKCLLFFGNVLGLVEGDGLRQDFQIPGHVFADFVQKGHALRHWHVFPLFVGLGSTLDRRTRRAFVRHGNHADLFPC